MAVARSPRRRRHLFTTSRACRRVNEEHHRRLERMYASAPINQFFRPRLAIRQGEAEVVIPVRAEMHHAAGAAHGAVAFKALDDAAFFAANSLVADVFVLTSQFNLHFLRPVSDGEIRAVGRVLHASKRQVLAEAVATNAQGREIARGTGTFMPSTTKLDAAIGYS